MDDIIEFIIEFILDIGVEVAGSNKAPKWIRYPLMAFLGLAYAALILGLLIGGVWLLEKSAVFGVLLFVLGLVVLFAGWHTVQKQIQKHRNQKIDSLE